MGERKAAIKAERDALMAERDALVDEANRNAKALQQLAADITAGIEALPAPVRLVSRPVMEQHARRVLALAAQYVVESKDPDPRVMRQISWTRKVVVGAVAAAVLAVPVGFGEEAGGDAWSALREQFSTPIEASDLKEPIGLSLGEAVSRAITELGLSDLEFAEMSGFPPDKLAQIQHSQQVPDDSTVRDLFDAFGSVHTGGPTPAVSALRERLRSLFA